MNCCGNMSIYWPTSGKRGDSLYSNTKLVFGGLFAYFGVRVPLCSPGWPRSSSNPASACCVLGLYVSVPKPGWPSISCARSLNFLGAEGHFLSVPAGVPSSCWPCHGSMLNPPTSLKIFPWGAGLPASGYSIGWQFVLTQAQCFVWLLEVCPWAGGTARVKNDGPASVRTENLDLQTQPW